MQRKQILLALALCSATSLTMAQVVSGWWVHKTGTITDTTNSTTGGAMSGAGGVLTSGASTNGFGMAKDRTGGGSGSSSTVTVDTSNPVEPTVTSTSHGGGGTSSSGVSFGGGSTNGGGTVGYLTGGMGGFETISEVKTFDIRKHGGNWGMTP